MFLRTIVAAALLAAVSMTAGAASPSGDFNVTGTNPGGAGTYSGTVSVTPTGDTFRVVWHVGSDTVQGTGLWVDDKFCIGYQGNSVAVMTEQSDGSWKGHWANGSDRSVGTERWTQ